MTSIEQVPAARLRSECLYLGIVTTNLSRNDMITELSSAGLYTVDLRFPAKPPRINTSCRKDDCSNVYLGNGAGLLNDSANQLYIANTSTETPLIGGDFKEHRVHINTILNISNSLVKPCLPGLEGDIVREGSVLFMFRCTNVEPGWYPLQFGTVKII
jgi:hypothetical protein